jgi:hypothetical protein
MLNRYRVIAPFSAKQLDREPLYSENFGVGESLIVLRNDGAHVVFSVQNAPPDSGGQRKFTLSGDEFGKLTEAD